LVHENVKKKNAEVETIVFLREENSEQEVGGHWSERSIHPGGGGGKEGTFFLLRRSSEEEGTGKSFIKIDGLRPLHQEGE